MRKIKLLSLIIPVLIFVISCNHFYSKFSGLRSLETKEKWDSEIWEGLLREIDDERGDVFSALKTLIKDRIISPVIFAGYVEGGAGDEIFLLSPRNTKLRLSVWDRTFLWKKTEGGTNYVFHLYADGKEVLKEPQDQKRRTQISDEEVDLIPKVEYTWDVKTCVKICNLSLSSSAFDRPKFLVMTKEEEEEVSDWLFIVDEWCQKKNIKSLETKVALCALVFEHFGLYMEEEDLLKGALKDYPDSATLHLILSGCLDIMECPRGAEGEYLKARELSIPE